MVAMCMICEGSYDEEIAKAVAASEGLKIALEAGLADVILETDSLKLFLLWKNEIARIITLGLLLGISSG